MASASLFISSVRNLTTSPMEIMPNYSFSRMTGKWRMRRSVIMAMIVSIPSSDRQKTTSRVINSTTPVSRQREPKSAKPRTISRSENTPLTKPSSSRTRIAPILFSLKMSAATPMVLFVATEMTSLFFRDVQFWSIHYRDWLKITNHQKMKGDLNINHSPPLSLKEMCLFRDLGATQPRLRCETMTDT